MTSSKETVADTSHTSTKQPMGVQTLSKAKSNYKNIQPQEEEQSSGCTLI
jgi:hypothetical protein